MKVVIIEDEETLLRVLQDKFRKSGFEIDVALDGEQAIPVVERSQPDLIILDLILPKKSGFEVLQLLKRDAKLKSIPIIVLSNLGQDEDIKKALQLGANDYLVKTQHPLDEVIEKTKNLLRVK